MRKILTFAFSCAYVMCFSQPVYNSSNYASIGDVFNLTTAAPSLANFSSTGANHTWNFGNLKGVCQQQLVFKDPQNTGFNLLTWPYLFIGNNVNLASTNDQSFSIGGLTETNNNNYFSKSGSSLSQKACSFSIAYNNASFDIKNTYSSADVLYQFPLNYEDSYSSNGGYVSQFPGLYYVSKSIQRNNRVDGWGSLVTPKGTFSNCLRIHSDVTEKDSFSIQGTAIPSLTTNYIEFRWLDPSTGYPVLYVQQIKLGNIYVTSIVQYIDQKQEFAPTAAFSYVPSSPNVNDTVTFQNLSVNGANYVWDFGDGETSTDINPKHVYTTAGVYHVTLTVNNGSQSNSITQDITVSSVLAVKLISFTGSYNKSFNLLSWSAVSEDGDKYNLQRSANGTTYTTINTVSSSKASDLANFSYKDAGFSQGKNYYRLQMTDKNGIVTYSNVVLLTTDGGLPSSLKVSPDPVIRGGNVNVVVSSVSSGSAVINVLNAEGKPVQSIPVTLATGNNVFILSTGKLAHGLYYVVVKGVTNASAKILVQ
jgi:PKD repeat protein